MLYDFVLEEPKSPRVWFYLKGRPISLYNRKTKVWEWGPIVAYKY
jgi:hypothetical protein